MKNLYKFDPDTGKYIGTVEAELDEWQTQIAGYPCYKGIANATWDAPEEKTGYTPYMVNGKWELVADPTLDTVKTAKVAELKAQRDVAEVEPIEYNGNKFDYDDKARERINAAIIALDVQSEQTKSVASIDWTTADNKDVKVTADDLRTVIALVANRSNSLHVAYREAKEKVEAATTKAEVEAVTL